MIFTKVKKMFSLVMSAVLCLQVFAVDMCCHAARNNKVDILYATDDGYFFPTLVSMQSAIDNMKENTFYNFHVMVDGNFSNAEKLNEFKNKNSDKCSIEIHNMGNKYKNCYGGRNNWPASMYYRLDAPTVLSDVDKCIYIDGDTLVMGDLCELFNTDLGGAYIGGVLDACSTREASPKTLTQCINSGVLLMDLNSMRTKKMSWYNDDNSTLKEYTVSEVIEQFVNLNNTSHTFDLPDQDILNKIFYQKYDQEAVGRKKLLPLKYNFMDNLFTCNSYGTYGREFDKTYVSALKDSEISFGKHQYWPIYTGSKGKIWNFMPTSNEDREFTDEYSVKHFKFKNGTEILTHPNGVKTYTDEHGNQYTANTAKKIWKKDDNLESDNKYIIDAYGDIHKIRRKKNRKALWEDRGATYWINNSCKGFDDGDHITCYFEVYCRKDGVECLHSRDKRGIETWRDKSGIEHCIDLEGNQFKLEDNLWVSEDNNQKYLIDKDGKKYQITDESDYLFEHGNHYWTDENGIRHKISSETNAHYEQRLVEQTNDRQKAINTIPDFMDSPEHLIIENIKENYPVIVHFICDKPWKSSCRVGDKGKNREIWNSLHAKWRTVADKVTSDYGVKWEAPVQKIYIKENIYIEKPQNNIKQNETNNPTESNKNTSSGFKDNLKWILGGSAVGTALIEITLAGVKKLFADEPTSSQSNKNSKQNKKVESYNFY